MNITQKFYNKIHLNDVLILIFFLGGAPTSMCHFFRPSVRLSVSGTGYHMIIIFDTLVESDNISRCSFHFFLMLIFQVLRGVIKGQKIVQNDKKFCPSHCIFQEQNIMWLSFMVHIWKMIISLGIFVSFSKFWFFGLLGE